MRGFWLGRFVRVTAAKILPLFFRTKLTGADNVPQGGAVLAGNHVSYMDPVLLWCVSPRPVHFMAKRELVASDLAGAVVAVPIPQVERVAQIRVEHLLVERVGPRAPDERPVDHEGDAGVLPGFEHAPSILAGGRHRLFLHAGDAPSQRLHHDVGAFPAVGGHDQAVERLFLQHLAPVEIAGDESGPGVLYEGSRVRHRGQLDFRNGGKTVDQTPHVAVGEPGETDAHGWKLPAARRGLAGSVQAMISTSLFLPSDRRTSIAGAREVR